MKKCTTILLLIASLGYVPSLARAQALVEPTSPFGATAATVPTQMELSYTPPSQATQFRNYTFDGFGPYPIVGSAMLAGLGQVDNTPPEWKQSGAGYGKRFGSDFGIAAVSTTTRYALAEALKEDTLYYRCECTGTLPRLRHAVLSTLTARHGLDGHRAFSISAVVAPYAGSATAVYAWYPGNYGAGSALKIGSYGMLASLGENIMMEFFYSGPHSMLSRMHLNNPQAAPAPGSK
jgi:hypothetical protein